VHLARNTLRPVARRDASQVANELRTIYTAPAAEAAGDAFARSRPPARRPQAALHHRRESLNYQLRKVTKARGHYPDDDAVVKLLWLATINIEDKRARERAPCGRLPESAATSRLVEGRRVRAGARPSASSTLPTRTVYYMRSSTKIIQKSLHTLALQVPGERPAPSAGMRSL